MKTQFTFILLLLLGLSCSSQENVEAQEGDNIVIVDGRDSVLVSYGKTVNFSSKQATYKLTLNDVRDGRCPSDQCAVCYGSIATVTVTLASGNNPDEKIELSIVGCGSNNLSFATIQNREQLVKLRDLQVGLASLRPYPVNSQTEYNKNQYVAKILIKPL